MPKISVLMSTYNHEAFVAEAVESVLAQDFTDWELVIRDDASTDGTAGVVRQFQDARIRILPPGPNLGGAASLNQCLRAARGEFIALLNSDDLMFPDRLSRSLAVLESRPELAAVFGRVQAVDESSLPLEEGSHRYCSVFNQPNRSRQEWLNHFFYHGNALCHPSILIRRHVYDELGLYDALMVQLPDFDMWVRLCARHEIHVMEQALTKFRVLRGEANASGDTPARRERVTYEHTKILARYATSPILEELHKILPEWVRPTDSRPQRLKALAHAMMSRPSSAHHHVGLDLFRQYGAEQGTVDAGGEPTGALLALMRNARPCTMAMVCPPLCYLFLARSGGEIEAEPSVYRPLTTGRRYSEAIGLPLEVSGLRLVFSAEVSEVHLQALSVHDASGAVLWDLAGVLRRGEKIQTEREVESPASSGGSPQEGGGSAPILSFQPSGGLSLPSFPAGHAAFLHYTLFVPGRDTSEAVVEVQELRQEMRERKKEVAARVKQIARLEKALAQANKQVASAVRWGQRPWYKRLFRRWKGATLNHRGELVPDAGPGNRGS